ncbi:MAG: hypothetical protein HKN41_04535 [Ilumatobacter sp.]|nr:hypothetical protein [Ilumatobacter sp.]
MFKQRARKILFATALSGALAVGSAASVAAGDDDDEGDEDDGAAPTGVDTGGVFDDANEMIPLAAATGLVLVAGGALVVRRRAES